MDQLHFSSITISPVHKQDKLQLPIQDYTLLSITNKTNENLDIYNAGLKDMCEQNGYTYLDVASVMKDDEGNLKREYCSDPDNMGVHFTDEGCKVWIDYLRTHVS